MQWDCEQTEESCVLTWLFYFAHDGKIKQVSPITGRKSRFIMKKVLWFSRHLMKVAQAQALMDKLGDVDITQVNKSIQSAQDIAQEIERLKKEQKRLEGELARVNGMLSNEKFISKAPEAKIAEEKGKLEKYTQMMAQVNDRLAQLQ